MAQIFISYRRGPTGYVATLLADEIRARFGPTAVFMDIDNIPLGVDFRDHIGAAVSECQVLLAVIGDDWLVSKLPNGMRRIDASDDFVRVEIEAALQRGIPVVPILTNTANVPAEADLPESLRPLAFRNAAELRSGRDLKSQMGTLIRQLSSLSSSGKISAANGDSSIRTPLFSIISRWKERYRSISIMCAIIAVTMAVLLLVAQLTKNKTSAKQQRTNVREVILQMPEAVPIPLYKSADQHSATFGSLLRGSRVVIVDTFRGADGQTWSKISINRGWVAAINFADPEFAMLRPTNTATLQTGQPAVISYTGSDGLNLRESPNPQSKVVAILLAQTQVMVVNEKLATKEHEWWGIEVPSAYILTDSVSMQ